MEWLRRMVTIIFALSVAIATGLAALPILALFDPVTREAGLALAEFAVFVVAGFEPDAEYAASGADLVSFVWAVLVAIGVAPLVFTALIGEVARVRSFLWYSIGTGVVAAVMPWLIRGALRTERMAMMSQDELHFACVFFLAGTISGSVYWLLACGEPSR
jgi:hypothetical protein